MSTKCKRSDFDFTPLERQKNVKEAVVLMLSTLELVNQRCLINTLLNTVAVYYL